MADDVTLQCESNVFGPQSLVYSAPIDEVLVNADEWLALPLPSPLSPWDGYSTLLLEVVASRRVATPCTAINAYCGFVLQATADITLFLGDADKSCSYGPAPFVGTATGSELCTQISKLMPCTQHKWRPRSLLHLTCVFSPCGNGNIWSPNVASVNQSD